MSETPNPARRVPTGPNPIRVGISVAWSLRHPAPRPTGRSVDQPNSVDHAPFAPILDAIAQQGTAALGDLRKEMAEYQGRLEALDPDSLTRDEALAYWLNLYNIGALRLAADAHTSGSDTVLGIPGAFTRIAATVQGRRLSLDAIEHAKVRRFKDPRIHAALVCGSGSCPTLRYEPFEGESLHDQLDDQMRKFLATGGAVRRGDTLYLSRIFLWYGGDMVRPHRMPTFLPGQSETVARSIAGWMEPQLADWVMGPDLEVRFQAYDWSLGCAIG